MTPGLLRRFTPRNDNSIAPVTTAIAAPRSPAGNCEYRFLDLRLGEIFGLFQIDMREVGHFIGRNDAPDDGRAFGLERLVDGLAQLTRLFGLEPYPAAGARQRNIIRIGEVHGFPGRQPHRTRPPA